ncbi:MAG: YitT family protein [Clostridia bacterium]
MWLKKAAAFLLRYFYIIIGAVIGAVGINVFLVPNKIAPGGVTGLATILYYATGMALPVGVLIIIINIPIFIAGFFILGRNTMFRVAFTTVVFSLAIDLTASFTHDLAQRYIDIQNADHLLLFALFGGAIMGVGLGIIFKMRSNTGGVDLLAEMFLRKGVRLSMGQTMLIMDAIIVVTASLVFQSILIGLYTIIAIFVFSRVVDGILDGIESAKGFFIISDHPEEISQAILKTMNRGLTGLKGTGKYTGNEKEVLFCVVRPIQIPAMKRLIKSIDPKAFVIVTDVHEALGEGFKGFDNKNT